MSHSPLLRPAFRIACLIPLLIPVTAEIAYGQSASDVPQRHGPRHIAFSERIGNRKDDCQGAMDEPHRSRSGSRASGQAESLYR